MIRPEIWFKCQVVKADIRPEIKFLEVNFVQKSVSRSRDTLDKGLKWAELSVKSIGLDVAMVVIRLDSDLSVKWVWDIYCLACDYARKLISVWSEWRLEFGKVVIRPESDVSVKSVGLDVAMVVIRLESDLSVKWFGLYVA